MKIDIELEKQFIDELIDLWFECSIRCERIEYLIKKINKQKLSEQLPADKIKFNY